MAKELNLAKKNIVNSLVKDGYEIVLNSGGIARVKLNKSLAKKNINDGIFSDWVADEISYLESIE